MKEYRFLILGILAMIGAVAVMIVALLLPYNQTQADPAEKRIAVLVPQNDTRYWDQVVQGIEGEMDADVSVQITRVPETDIEEQYTRFEMAVAADVDGIIVQLSDNTRLAEMMEKAEAAGIPVILVNSDAADSGRQYYVGSDHYLAGQAMAQLLYEQTGGQAKIAIISGLKNQGSQHQRIQGFSDALKRWPGMEIVCVEYSNMDSVQAAQTTQMLLKAYPEINTFLGISSADIEGIIKTIETKLNRDAYHLIGFDDSDIVIRGIEKGTVLATVAQDSHETGRQAALLLEQAMETDEENAPVVHLTDQFVVTEESLDQYGQWIQERRYE